VETATPQRLCVHLGECGPGGAKIDDLPEVLGVSRRTVWRAVDDLIATGAADRHAPGRIRARAFRGSPPAMLPNEQAEQLWRILDRRKLPAYLSGMDVLAGQAHHFVFDYAHVVVTQPGTGTDVAGEIARAGFMAMQAGRLSFDAELTRVVVVRELSWERYPIVCRLAPPELAWVDLYREVRRKSFAFPPAELGRILQSILVDPAARQRLATFARDHFTGEIESIIAGDPEPGFASQVAAGYSE
jgi:HTH domain